MNKVAGKYFLPVFLGSVLVFAIGCEHADMAAAPIRSEATTHFNDLSDDGFWGKFRDSVMKDRDKNEPSVDNEPSNPNGGGEGDHGPGGPGGHGGDGGPGGHGDGGGAGRR